MDLSSIIAFTSDTFNFTKSILANYRCERITVFSFGRTDLHHVSLNLIFEACRLVLLGTSFIYFCWTIKGKKWFVRKDCKFVLAGFVIYLISAFLDSTDQIFSLNQFVIVGNTWFEAILEKIVCPPLGFLFLLLGFLHFKPYQTNSLLKPHALSDILKHKKLFNKSCSMLAW